MGEAKNSFICLIKAEKESALPLLPRAKILIL